MLFKDNMIFYFITLIKCHITVIITEGLSFHINLFMLSLTIIRSIYEGILMFIIAKCFFVEWL